MTSVNKWPVAVATGQVGVFVLQMQTPPQIEEAAFMAAEQK